MESRTPGSRDGAVRDEVSVWKRKAAATADASARGAASLVFIASPCPLLPEGEIAIYLFTACSFLTAGAAHFLVAAAASVESTMEEKKIFGKEHRRTPSRSD